MSKEEKQAQTNKKVLAQMKADDDHIFGSLSGDGKKIDDEADEEGSESSSEYTFQTDAESNADEPSLTGWQELKKNVEAKKQWLKNVFFPSDEALAGQGQV